MTKIFDKQIDRILKERRERALNIAEQNLRNARSNEEYTKIEKEEVEKIIELATLMADEVDETKERIHLSEIRARKSASLKKLGLNESDTTPQFECRQCGDTGTIKGKRCKCRTKILNEILLKRSGLSSGLEDFFNATFEDNKDSNTETAFKLLKEWADNFPNVKKRTIFISGAVGVGKTYLLKCIANQLIKKEVYVFYSTAFKMNNDFLEYCKAGSDEKSYFLSPYLDSEVLLIDDLGTEPILNNVTLDYLYLVLNERMIAGKSVIINSNLEIDAILDRYGERIFSRIIDKRNGLALKLSGKDLRLRKSKSTK
jgi:DNA replication protein DnaC